MRPGRKARLLTPNSASGCRHNGKVTIPGAAEKDPIGAARPQWGGGPRNAPGAVLSDQIGCDHRACARLCRTLRPAQDIGPFLQCKSLQLPTGDDRACDIEFATHRASNADARECRRDSLCDGAANRTVHVLSPADWDGKQCRWRSGAPARAAPCVSGSFIPNVIHSDKSVSPLICHFRDKCAMSDALYLMQMLD